MQRKPPHKCILVLSGWSDGPLHPLQYHLNNEVQFIQVHIPTPPAGCRWLLNPYLCLLLGLLYCTPMLFRSISSSVFPSSSLHYISIMGLVLLLCIALRKTVAYLVQYAVRDSVRIVTKAIEKYNPIAIVGFSWGAGILYEILDVWQGHALLLAPTIFPISSIASTPCTEYNDEATRATTGHRRVVIVCGDDDPFCSASQKKFLTTTTPFEYISVHDDHVLCEKTTRDLCLRIVKDFIHVGRVD